MTGCGQEIHSSNDVTVAGVAVASAVLVLMIIGVLIGFRWWRKERNELRKDIEKYYSSPQSRKRIVLRRMLDTNNFEEVINSAKGTDAVPSGRADHLSPRSPPVIRQLEQHRRARSATTRISLNI